MHHIHMSTGFMFVITLFVLGAAALILAFILANRRDRLAAEARQRELDYYASLPATTRYPELRDRPVVSKPDTADVAAFERHYGVSAPATVAAPWRPATPVIQQVAQPAVVAAPVYHGNDAMLGLATGMMLGSAMGHGHHHDTVVHHHDTVVVDSPSYASSPSYSDSGFSYSDSSSSYDSGSSSGGFDASW